MADHAYLDVVALPFATPEHPDNITVASSSTAQGASDEHTLSPLENDNVPSMDIASAQSELQVLQDVPALATITSAARIPPGARNAGATTPGLAPVQGSAKTQRHRRRRPWRKLIRFWKENRTQLGILFRALFALIQILVIVVLLSLSATQFKVAPDHVETEWDNCQRLGVWSALWAGRATLAILMNTWELRRYYLNKGRNQIISPNDLESVTARPGSTYGNGQFDNITRSHARSSNINDRLQAPSPSTSGEALTGACPSARTVCRPQPAYNTTIDRLNALLNVLAIVHFVVNHIFLYTSLTTCRFSSPHLWWLAFSIASLGYIIVLSLLITFVVYILGPALRLFIDLPMNSCGLPVDRHGTQKIDHQLPNAHTPLCTVNHPTYVLGKNETTCLICLKDFAEARRREAVKLAWWRKLPHDDPNAPVESNQCLYTPREPLRMLACGHTFHRACVDPWLSTVSHRCPVCSRNVEIGSRTPSNSADENASKDITSFAFRVQTSVRDGGEEKDEEQHVPESLEGESPQTRVHGEPEGSPHTILRVTPYRLTGTCFSIAAGVVVKAVVCWNPNDGPFLFSTIDWVVGGTIGVLLTWIGFVEPASTGFWHWFLCRDYFRCIVAVVVWPLRQYERLLGERRDR